MPCAASYIINIAMFTTQNPSCLVDIVQLRELSFSSMQAISTARALSTATPASLARRASATARLHVCPGAGTAGVDPDRVNATIAVEGDLTGHPGPKSTDGLEPRGRPTTRAAPRLYQLDLRAPARLRALDGSRTTFTGYVASSGYKDGPPTSGVPATLPI